MFMTTPLGTPVYRFALRPDLETMFGYPPTVLVGQDCLLPVFFPKQGEPLATGWDVRAAQVDQKPITLRAGQYFKIPLGFRAFCPEGWWFKLEPRSSTFAKKKVHALCGIIDETYENELVFAGQYIPDLTEMGHDLVINFGDAIGQIIPFQRQPMIVQGVSNVEFDQLCALRNGKRGTGGFGSTGT